MKKSTRKDIREYKTSYRLNRMFRDVDDTLAGSLTPDERVKVMTLIWPAVSKIAGEVMKRAISDLTQMHIRAGLITTRKDLTDEGR